MQKCAKKSLTRGISSQSALITPSHHQHHRLQLPSLCGGLVSKTLPNIVLALISMETQLVQSVTSLPLSSSNRAAHVGMAAAIDLLRWRSTAAPSAVTGVANCVHTRSHAAARSCTKASMFYNMILTLQITPVLLCSSQSCTY